jgi:hypothetical protein
MNVNIPEGFSKYLGPHVSVFNDDVLLYSASNFNCNEEFEDSKIEEEVMCQIEEEMIATSLVFAAIKTKTTGCENKIMDC